MSLKFLILQSLSHCRGYLLPERTLIAEVCNSSRATEAEVKLAIAESQSLNLITGATNPLDDQRRWGITDLGKTTLAQY